MHPGPEHRVSIEDQALVVRSFRECFAKLLHHPFAGRVLGDIKVDDLSAVVLNQEQAVQISNPSFNSSRWMRGAPQVGFSFAMMWREARTSCPVTGLPRGLLRDRKRQYRRNPFRCHRTTVSGLTIRRGFDHFGQTRRSRTENNRSERRKWARLVRRFKTTNCCLKATISSPKS
jgi:hypothetical protein